VAMRRGISKLCGTTQPDGKHTQRRLAGLVS
jgi:hypothetical protein